MKASCNLAGIMVLTQISRSRFKQSKISLLIPHVYVLGCFVKFFFCDFWLYLIWGLIIFLKGLVKFIEIARNRKFDLMLFLNKNLKLKIG